MANGQKIRRDKSTQRSCVLMSQPGEIRFSHITLYLVKIADAVALHFSFKLPYKHLYSSRWTLTNQQHIVLYNTSFNHDDFNWICFKQSKSCHNEMKHNANSFSTQRT